MTRPRSSACASVMAITTLAFLLAGEARAAEDVPNARAAAPDAPVEAPAVDEEPVFVDLAGREVRVSQHLGHVLVLNFWATWCGPCRAELPALGRVQEEFAAKGVRLVAAASNGRDDGPAVTALLDQLGVKVEPWLWVSAKDMRHWGVGPGIPATVVLDAQGAIRATFRGPVTQEQLRPVLTALVAETEPGAK